MLHVDGIAGKVDSIPDTEEKGEGEDEESYTLPHPIWSKEEAEKVEITHTPPKDKVDKVSHVHDSYVKIGRYNLQVLLLLFINATYFNLSPCTQREDDPVYCIRLSLPQPSVTWTQCIP